MSTCLYGHDAPTFLQNWTNCCHFKSCRSSWDLKYVLKYLTERAEWVFPQHSIFNRYLSEYSTWPWEGAHHQEAATTLYSCHGVFTDRSIFSLDLSRIQIPTGTSVTNCSHKHRLSCRHVHVRLHCFILTEACSCRLELAYFAGKLSKIDWSVKMPLHWLIYESCMLQVMPLLPWDHDRSYWPFAESSK